MTQEVSSVYIPDVEAKLATALKGYSYKFLKLYLENTAQIN